MNEHPGKDTHHGHLVPVPTPGGGKGGKGGWVAWEVEQRASSDFTEQVSHPGPLDPAGTHSGTPLGA